LAKKGTTKETRLRIDLGSRYLIFHLIRSTGENRRRRENEAAIAVLIKGKMVLESSHSIRNSLDIIPLFINDIK